MAVTHPPNNPPTLLQTHPFMSQKGGNEICLEKTQKRSCLNERMKTNEIGSDGGLCVIVWAPPRIPGKDGLGMGLESPCSQCCSRGSRVGVGNKGNGRG